ncbi:unnamed protein product [Danaus chrysippus]|uniref:(African queen) hypothetical protein n=1 Tax=Danaus chrysippus TaxID=151541 RepID=A0A8J2QSP3_9NEOP|nr:unnamed protein product [Danaus chrysippus]
MYKKRIKSQRSRDRVIDRSKRVKHNSGSCVIVRPCRECAHVVSSRVRGTVGAGVAGVGGGWRGSAGVVGGRGRGATSRRGPRRGKIARRLQVARNEVGPAAREERGRGGERSAGEGGGGRRGVNRDGGPGWWRGGGDDPGGAAGSGQSQSSVWSRGGRPGRATQYTFLVLL